MLARTGRERQSGAFPDIVKVTPVERGPLGTLASDVVDRIPIF